MNELSVLLVFAAGLASFLSPCCLPLIPSYLSFIGGTSRVDDSAGGHLISRTISFVLGFSVIFIALSIVLVTTFSALGGIAKYVNLVAGVIIIIIGFNIAFNITTRIKNRASRTKLQASPDSDQAKYGGFVCEGCEANYEKRYNNKKRPEGVISAFLVGAAFAVAWTPCVGPMLTSILFLASQDGNLVNAILYLGVYSIGLGLPFIFVAIFFEKFLDYINKTLKYQGMIRLISGVILVCVGVTIAFGQFQTLNIVIQKWQYQFIDWVAVSEGGLMIRLIPALIAIFIVTVIIAGCLLHKKSLLNLKIAVPCVIFVIIATLQLSGTLNSAELIANWLLSLQTL